MKKLSILLFTLFIFQNSKGQVSGNVNYQSQTKFAENNINVPVPTNVNQFISVKGLANVKADSYVAIFNITQSAETPEEVNRIVDERIGQVKQYILTQNDVEIFVDMISFVANYEYEVEKKIFSKKTYNEIPTGFEIKKNLHIKFSNADFLNEILPVLAKAEIYDLVRVDYFSTEMETAKKDLMKKAKVVLEEKMANYQSILSVELDSVEKFLSEGFRVVFPVEMYKSYQAYNSLSVYSKKRGDLNPAQKSTTLYYQPLMNKEFDFVINPIILEPVIQVMYEIKLNFADQNQPKKEYILVTPNGDLKNLDVK